MTIPREQKAYVKLLAKQIADRVRELETVALTLPIDEVTKSQLRAAKLATGNVTFFLEHDLA